MHCHPLQYGSSSRDLTANMSATPPSIRISSRDAHDRERFAIPRPSTNYPMSNGSPGAMTIPRAQSAVPPPLPPPSFIPDLVGGRDPGWQWGNDPSGTDFGRATPIKPGSSLLGGLSARALAGHDNIYNGQNSSFRRDSDVRRGSSISTIIAARDQRGVDQEMTEAPSDSRDSSSYRYVRQ